MQNWLRRQNRFTYWTAMGTAASAATGMAATATLVIAIIAASMLGQRTYFGITYPPVLDQIAEAALYVIGVCIVSFLISVAGLITSLLVGSKTGQEQAGE